MPGRKATASAASGATARWEVRRVVSDGLHPATAPDLNCGQIPYRNFTVRWDVADPDPHHFDGDHDGVGCET